MAWTQAQRNYIIERVEHLHLVQIAVKIAEAKSLNKSETQKQQYCFEARQHQGTGDCCPLQEDIEQRLNVSSYQVSCNYKR